MISKIIHKVLHFISYNPKKCLILVFVLVAISTSSLLNIEIIDNVDYFRIENLESTKQYDLLKKEFGEDEFFIILISSDNIFSNELLSSLNNIHKELDKLKEIKKIRSLINVEEIKGGADYFEVGKLFNAGQITDQEIIKLQNIIKINPLYRDTIVNSKQTSFSIIVWPKIDPKNHTFRKELLTKVDCILRNESGRNQTFSYAKAGWTITNYSLSKYSRFDLLKLIPICFVLMVTLISIAFKNIYCTFIASVNMLCSLIVVLSIFSLLKIPVTNITVAAIPVILSLTLADTVHIFNYIRFSNNSPNNNERIFIVLKEAISPCLLTSLTTCIGFLSSSTNELKPLAEFGIIAAFGMVIELVFSFTIIPSLILLSSNTNKYFLYSKSRDHNIKSTYFSDLVLKNSSKVIFLFIILSLYFLYVVPRINVNTNLVDYLDKSLSERKEVDIVESSIGGLQTLDVVLTSSEANTFKKSKNLNHLDLVHQYIEKQDGVSKVMSLVPFIKEMNRAFHNGDDTFYKISDSDEQINQYLLLYDSSETEDLVVPNYSKSRIIVRSILKKTSEQRKFIEELEKGINVILPNEIRAVITGRMVDQVVISDAIVRGQIESLSFTLVFVGIIMVMALRSLKLGLISLIPNIIPVIGSFAFMSLSNIPLDTGTSLIASIVLGVAIDDTIHFLTSVKKFINEGLPVEEALRKVIEFKGFSISITSIILSLGFGVLCFGSFVPIQNFGYLTAYVMFFAPLADLLLLPAILIKFPNLVKN